MGKLDCLHLRPAGYGARSRRTGSLWAPKKFSWEVAFGGRFDFWSGGVPRFASYSIIHFWVLGQERPMAERPIASILTYFGTLLASPTAFLVVLVYAALWFVFERDTFDWHAIATLATWLMTLVIQRSEHRDTQAIHAKLDEVLRALEGAQTGLARIDDEEPEDIEKYREKVKGGD
jgi:low affinity Fe/Cu permease